MPSKYQSGPWNKNPGIDGEMEKNKMENRRRRHTVRVSTISYIN